MKTMAVIASAFLALSSVSTALANGQGSPVEPTPQTPIEQPTGPAEGTVAQVSRPAQSQNYWLIGLGIAALVGIIVAVSGDDDDDEPSSP